MCIDAPCGDATQAGTGRGIFDGLGECVLHGGPVASDSFYLDGGAIGFIVIRACRGGNIDFDGQIWSVVTCATGSAKTLISDMEDVDLVSGIQITAMGAPDYNHRVDVGFDGSQENYNVYWIRIGD